MDSPLTINITSLTYACFRLLYQMSVVNPNTYLQSVISHLTQERGNSHLFEKPSLLGF